MSQVIYCMGPSLDGFVEDRNGNFGWSTSLTEVLQIASQQTREMKAFVFGRRLYETMEPFWPEMAERGDGEPVMQEFADAYAATPRIVVSDSLAAAGEGCRLVRREQARAEVERLKAEPGGPVEVGGPTLAHSLADLIDEIRLWLNPVLVGDGKRFFPPVTDQVDFTLAECRPIGDVIWLRYTRKR
jgi:dihydrofolate reductase